MLSRGFDDASLISSEISSKIINATRVNFYGAVRIMGDR